jgi:hypothetical protein
VIAKRLFSSVPFDTYVILLILGYLGIKLPGAVYEIAGTFGSANAFLAMFMLGGALEFSFAGGSARELGTFLFARYAANAVFALGLYYLLPFPLMIRQILVILVFSPFAAISVAFTERLGLDKSKAALLNSLSIAISITLITLLLGWFKMG